MQETKPTTATKDGRQAGAAGGRPATRRGRGLSPACASVPASEGAPVRDLNHDSRSSAGTTVTAATPPRPTGNTSSISSPTSCTSWACAGCAPRASSPGMCKISRPLAGREACPGNGQEPDEPAPLARAEDRQGQHRRADQCRLRHPGSGVRHQHLQGKGAWQGTARRDRTPCARMSLRLQAAFGLRREASIKIVPAWADRGDTLVLKDSWNKGGGDPDSHPHPGAAAAPRRGQGARQGQEPGRARLRHLPRLPAALPLCVRASRYHAFHGHRHLYARPATRK